MINAKKDRFWWTCFTWTWMGIDCNNSLTKIFATVLKETSALQCAQRVKENNSACVVFEFQQIGIVEIGERRVVLGSLHPSNECLEYLLGKRLSRASRHNLPRAMDGIGFSTSERTRMYFHYPSHQLLRIWSSRVSSPGHCFQATRQRFSCTDIFLILRIQTV